MTLIHCPGHEFTHVEHKADGKVYAEHWNCDNCLLTVKTQEAADYLTGKTC